MPLLQFISSEPLKKSSFVASVEGINEYFSRCLQTQPPEQVLQAFISLAEGKKEGLDAEIVETLKQLTEFSFHQVLNHGCQILISDWYQKQCHLLLITELFERLDTFAATNHKLIQGTWTKSFVKSITYRQLKRILFLMPSNSYLEQTTISEQSLDALFSHYPFLYKYGSLSLDAHRNYRKMIRDIREQATENFSIKLAKYATYRVRLLQIAKAKQLTQGAGRFLRPASNPTLLDDRQLNNTLCHLAQTFHQNSSPIIGTFTAVDLLNYLFSNLNNTSPQHRHFKRLLCVQFEPLMSNVSQSILNESSLLDCGRRLLNVLIIDNSACFLPTLATYLNASEIVSLLMKLIRLCPQLQLTLESKLFQVFEKYQSTPQSELTWLISVLETYLVASSLLNNGSLIRDINICIMKGPNFCAI